MIPEILQIYKYDEDILIACLRKYTLFNHYTLYQISILSNNNKNIILEYFNQNNRAYYYLSAYRYIINPYITKENKYIDDLKCVEEIYDNDYEILYKMYEYDKNYIEWMNDYQQNQVDEYYDELYSQIVFSY
jgi:hypothetical protein